MCDSHVPINTGPLQESFLRHCIVSPIAQAAFQPILGVISCTDDLRRSTVSCKKVVKVLHDLIHACSQKVTSLRGSQRSLGMAKKGIEIQPEFELGSSEFRSDALTNELLEL